MKYCYDCYNIWEGIGQPGYREGCNKCSADLHVCLNCRFYDERKPNQCQIDNVDPVRNKEKANFCDEFQFTDKPLPEKDLSKRKDVKEQWEKLFKRENK